MKAINPENETNFAVDPGGDLESELVSWRRDLHRYPEFGFDEFKTSEFVANKLNEFGLEVVQNIGETGVVGILSNGDSKRSLGLRADMDALQIVEKNEFDHRSRRDGLMHACGHDGHTVMLLGAARQLANNPNFNGTVHFIFQPAEEHGKGANAMIDDGLFERFQIDAVYGLHNMPSLPEGNFAVRPGAIMASESNFEITIKGKGGHAAMPHTGVDALVVASQCVISLQSIVSRNLSSLHQPAVVSVTEFITDGTVNVIPSNVTLKGDCRCFSDEVVEIIRSNMKRTVAGICSAAGAEYVFNFNTLFPSTINSNQETRHVIEAATQVFGENNVDGDCEPYSVSEDFANMLRVKPGCYGLIGNGGEALHNPYYDFNDSILAKGTQYWIQLVEDQLNK